MNSSGGSSSYTEYLEYQAGQYIWKIFPPILILFGTTGNILSIIVLRRKGIQKSVCSIYFVVLAVSDLIVLYTGLLRQWIYMTFEVDIREFGSGICKLHTWIVYFSLDFSSWILVAVTVERLGLVWFPHKTKSKCTKKLAGISLVVIAISLLLINSHILYGMTDTVNIVNETEVVEKCSFVSEDYEHFWDTSWPWIDLAIFCGIPFCCLLVGNLLIFTKVLLQQRALKRQIAPTAQTSSSHPKKSKLSSMSIMLFTLNTMFLICTTPISVYLIGHPTWNIESTAQQSALLDLMWAIVNILMYTNNSINFLLYVLSGSRFRREFRDLFRKQGLLNSFTARHDSATRLPPISKIQSNYIHREQSNLDSVDTIQ